MPACPCREKRNGLRIAFAFVFPDMNTSSWRKTGMAVPCQRSSSGLGSNRSNLARPTIHEQKDDTVCPRSEVWLLIGKMIRRTRCQTSCLTRPALTGQLPGQRQAAKAGTCRAPASDVSGCDQST